MYRLCYGLFLAMILASWSDAKISGVVPVESTDPEVDDTILIQQDHGYVKISGRSDVPDFVMPQDEFEDAMSRYLGRSVKPHQAWAYPVYWSCCPIPGFYIYVSKKHAILFNPSAAGYAYANGDSSASSKPSYPPAAGSNYQANPPSYPAPAPTYPAPAPAYPSPAPYQAPSQPYSAPQSTYSAPPQANYPAPVQPYSAPQQSYSAQPPSYPAPAQMQYSSGNQGYPNPNSYNLNPMRGEQSVLPNTQMY